MDRLSRHPRNRDVWGLDVESLNSSGTWTLRFTIDGPQGEGTGDLTIDVLEQPGPPLTLSWLVGLIPLALTLVFFGYTMCPDVCQLVMADVANALNRLEPAEREQVAMTFVTTEPARDDAATLRTYLDRFDPSFEGLTGPLPRIVELGEAVGVPIAKGQKLPSGGYEVDHGTHVLGMTDDGTVPILWTQGTPPELVADDIRRILAEGGVPTGGDS